MKKYFNIFISQLLIVALAGNLDYSKIGIWGSLFAVSVLALILPLATFFEDASKIDK